MSNAVKIRVHTLNDTETKNFKALIGAIIIRADSKKVNNARKIDRNN